MDKAFANQRNATSLARFVVYEAQAWMGDCLLVGNCSKTAQQNTYSQSSKIYRLYHVCGRRWWIVAAPCAMCTALAGECPVPSFERRQYDLHDSPQVCGFCLLRTTLKLNFLDTESMKPFHMWAVACFSLTFGYVPKLGHMINGLTSPGRTFTA